jgi:hypothetical protein
MHSSAVAMGVEVSEDTLAVELADGRTIAAPLAWYPRLAHATAEERASWRLIAGGRGIHWPALDEDISVANLLAGQPSAESQSSFKKWLGGAGGSPMNFDGDPDHPILDAPWTWELLEFVYHRDPADWRGSYIDMVLERGGVVRRLRFFAPQDLELSQGLPNTSGMCILDVRARQLDGLGVRVAEFEQSYGTPSFWAARVVDLDREGSA